MTRHLIAMSRMIYGLAQSAASQPDYLAYAKRATRFLLEKMLRRDAWGPYFVEAVDRDGVPISPTTKLVVNEQAYGLNGLVALYQQTHESALLDTIREVYSVFRARFHDDGFGGFYDTFDLTTQKPVRTKSYNSTVYVATSFLLELASADPARRAEYLATIHELTDRVVGSFLDPRTGWLFENFTRDWKPQWRNWQRQGEFTIGIVGHNFQTAWLLMRVARMEGTDGARGARYNAAARAILGNMLSKPVVDWEKGGFFDAFKRETDAPMWNTNKAWWQQAEAILALTLAEKSEVLNNAQSRRARDLALCFYFRHFVDWKLGGEFDVVDRDGIPTSDSMKGNAGKSAYHSIELARYELEYGGNDDETYGSTKPRLSSW